MSSFSLHNIIRHFAHFMRMNQNGKILRQYPYVICFLNALKYKEILKMRKKLHFQNYIPYILTEITII